MADSNTVPFFKCLHFTLAEGKEIIVSGVVKPSAAKFKICLCNGVDHTSKTPFYYSPRFTKKQVIRNSKDQEWGPEETNGGFPFKQGEAFEVKIIVQNDVYKVYVNNVHHIDYKHRLPKESVRHLYIQGDVTIDNISFMNTVKSPQLPQTWIIPGELKPVRKFYISGVPKGIDRFTVYFVCGSNVDKDDITFVFDVRFNFYGSGKLIVLNSRKGGNWEDEIRPSTFPFAADVPFNLIITVEDSGYKVLINNEHNLTFPHRIKEINRANHLHIDGAVNVTEVKFELTGLVS